MQRIVRDQFLEPTDGTEVIILGKLHRTAELSRKIAVNVRNPCASAGDINTLFLDMIVDLRRCTLQRMLDFLADLINTGKECFVYEGRSNDPFHWKTGCTIYAAHLPRLFFVCSKIRQRNLDTFGCFGANLEIVFAAVQIAYRFVELFSAYLDDSGKNNPRVGDNRNLCALRSDVDNHGTLRAVDRNAKCQRIRDWFIHKIHAAVF